MCSILFSKVRHYSATQKGQCLRLISLNEGFCFVCNVFVMFCSSLYLPAGERRLPGQPGVECVRYRDGGLGEGGAGDLHLLAQQLPGKLTWYREYTTFQVPTPGTENIQRS